MRAMLGGAAVAVMMAVVLGSAGRAEAAEITITDLSNFEEQDIYQGLNFYFDTSTHTGFTSAYSSLDGDNVYIMESVYGSVDVQKYNQGYLFVTIHTNLKFSDFPATTGYYDFVSSPSFALPSVNYNYYMTSSINEETITVSVTGTILPAPLPSSLPMFGAALFALGGLACARRLSAHRLSTANI